MSAIPPANGDSHLSGGVDAQREEIRRAAAGIEETLLRTMMQAMTKAQLESGGFFGQGAAEGTEQTTFEMVLTEALSKSSPLGIADQLADQLARGRGSLASAREAAAATPAEMAFRAGSNAPAPLPDREKVFKKFTPGPQGHENPSDEKGENSWTGRSPASPLR